MYLAMPFDGAGVVDFDESTGTIVSSDVPQRGIKIVGNIHTTPKNSIALFAKGGALYFQIDSQVWRFDTSDIELFYGHNVYDKTTEFRVKSPGDEVVITRPAWWADIVDFEPFEPEMDEDEDYLGYIYAIFSNPASQIHLLKSWG